ncbi:uncharacterized protein EI97DRAFT_356863, partial [Westerdykella ornata]
MPQPTPPSPAMPLAEILSDLTSLRVCDPSAALALVSARATSANESPTQLEAKTGNNEGEEEEDRDIRRAMELVKLHYEVREAQKRGELGRGLEEARRAV